MYKFICKILKCALNCLNILVLYSLLNEFNKIFDICLFYTFMRVMILSF